MARAFLRERGGHLQTLLVIGAGVYDGVLGHLNVRYPVVPMIEHAQPDGAMARREKRESHVPTRLEQ